MTEGVDAATGERGRYSRRSLIATSAGVATTVAVGAAVPAAVASARTDAPAVAVAPATPPPTNPIVAYVHDAARGEVTVVSGSSERTFRDRVLVERLLAAATATEAK